jgi:hypothetical protein
MKKPARTRRVYLGIFSIDETDGAEPRTQTVICVATALTAKEAAAKFKTLLTSTAKTKKGIERLDLQGEVFMDALIEFDRIPKAGVIAHFASRDVTEDHASILCTLPMAANDVGSEYSDKPENQEEAEPFVVLRAKKKASAPARI